MRAIVLSAALLLVACGGTTPEPAPSPGPATEVTPTTGAAEGAAVADAPAHAAPGDAVHGKEIVGSKCTSCHGTEVFTRTDRKVQSADALDAQVETCGSAAQLTASDKQDVKAYLTSEYYKFDPPQAPPSPE